MRTTLLVIAALATLTAATPGLAASWTPGLDNGVVIMMHGYDDTRLKDLPWGPVGGYPRAHETLVAARDGDAFEFAIIPFDIETERPVYLDGFLIVHTEDGRDIPAWPIWEFGNSIDTCIEQTSIPGHEGDLESCLVFRVPAEDVPPGSRVTFTFYFAGWDTYLPEPYSAVSHAMLERAARDGVGSFEEADKQTDPTPFYFAEKMF